MRNRRPTATAAARSPSSPLGVKEGEAKPEVTEEEASLEQRQVELLDKISNGLKKLPHSVEIALPNVLVDLLNAEKSGNVDHNSVHIAFGLNLKNEVGVGGWDHSQTLFDSFNSKPTGVNFSLELTKFESLYLTCNGIEVVLTALSSVDQYLLPAPSHTHSFRLALCQLQSQKDHVCAGPIDSSHSRLPPVSHSSIQTSFFSSQTPLFFFFFFS